MKTNQLFEKAKQAVAEKHQFENWEYGIFVSDHEDVKALYQEAAEWMCNESVKADRARIIESKPIDVSMDARNHMKVKIDEVSLNKIPLPFPQQPDER